jgi:nucleotide-binding universal stress UspA family protein
MGGGCERRPNMTNLEQIVVATDFSPASASALHVAGRIARLFNIKVTVVHVFQYPVHHRYPIRVGWMVEMIRKEVREKLNQARCVLEEMNVQAEGLMIGDGFASAEILNLLQKYENPLLVMGTHAVAGIDRFLLGSTAEEILRQAKCPVITVGPHVPREEKADPAFHRILYPTDGSIASMTAISLIQLLRRASPAPLRVLHVLDPAIESAVGDDVFEVVRSSLKHHEIASEDTCDEYVTLHGKDVGQAVVNEAERFSADLLILGVRRASAWASHLVPKVTYQIIAASPCPVMTVSS